jgi:Domain of unknown function (DUF397)
VNSTMPAPVWRTSSYSLSNGDCVEVASLGEAGMGVRDSKDRSGPVLTFSAVQWRSFVAGVRAGGFDR